MIRLDQNAIDQICENKHVSIDMACVVHELFPSEEAVIVLLRNLDIRSELVDLDFSNCSYESKASWLKCYATAPEMVEIKELAKSWAQIIHAMLSQQLEDVKCDLLDGIELKQFIKDNISLCTNVAQLLHDSMEWIACVAADKLAEYKSGSSCVLSPSMLFCCKHICDFDFALHAAFKTCKAWPKVFLPENIEPAKYMLQHSKCCTLLYGRHTPEWSAFMELVSKAQQLSK